MARVAARSAGRHVRRTRPIRRASAGLSPTRAAAALLMLASAAGIYGLAASPAFGLGRLDVQGVHYTGEAAVRERLTIAEGTNLFTITTGPLEADLRDLPAVAGVEVGVQLPDTIAVRVRERQPIVVWRVGEGAWLVDREGVLFAEAAAAPPDEIGRLPAVEDARAGSSGLAVGARLDPIDLDAATRLASLVPSELGSSATGLQVVVSDANGFVVRSVPERWVAIFGFYTPSLRTPELIPDQVRLMRSLLAHAGEENVARVVLASATEGTYATASPKRATPRP